MSRTTVLLTGVGGAIGVHMLHHIMSATEWHAVGIDSWRHKGRSSRLERLFKDHPEWRSRLTVITHDLAAPFDKTTAEAIGDPDYCINLASLSDVQASIDDPAWFIRNNTSLMVTMMEWARTRPGLRAFVHFSTDEVYGPISGDDTRGHPEWAPHMPSNPYAASKAAQEVIGIAYWRSYGVPLIITNTMNNFGEMQDPSKYPAMIQHKVAAGETVDVHVGPGGEIGSRYYIHSRDVADAVLFILARFRPAPHTPGAIDRPDRYNIVGSARLNNLELAQMIARHLGRDLVYRLVDFHSESPGHDLHYGLDGSKLEAMGWRPPFSIDARMRDTINWERGNR